MNEALLLAAIALAAAAGYGLLRKLGCDPFEAWSAGRVVGLVCSVFPAWLWGSAIPSGWFVVAVITLGILAAFGTRHVAADRGQIRSVVYAEGVFWAGVLFVLAIRLGHPEILGAEKPMDLGILASILRCESFPPPDMWMAGHALHYYYFGSLIWALPLKLSGVELSIGYNLIVGFQGGAVLSVAWALGRRVNGGRHGSGALAAALVAFAGTPDGWRQLIAGRGLTDIDFWSSSRQVANTITEFPFFTLWLGDLHPHLLSLPIMLSAVTVAVVCAQKSPSAGRACLLAILLSAAWMANPWCLPTTALAIALGTLCVEERRSWFDVDGRQRWVMVGFVYVSAAMATVPFHLGFQAPSAGIGFVNAWTRPLELGLFAGPLIALAFASALAYAARSSSRYRDAWLWLLAAVVLLCAVSMRPVLLGLTFIFMVLLHRLLAAESDGARSAVALALVGVVLFLGPELVYVRDPYGEDLHRMNTVFKAYFQGWVLLAVSTPMLIRDLAATRVQRWAVCLAILLIGAAHPLSAVSRLAKSESAGIDGLRWLSEGDRAIVRHLELLPPGSTMLEAVGDAYSKYGRLSAASGIPTFLGWANHERVWRGEAVFEEVDRRRRIADEIFSCGDRDQVQILVRKESIDVIAIGSLERQLYDAASLEEVIEAGTILLRGEGAVLVDMRNGDLESAEGHREVEP